MNFYALYTLRERSRKRIIVSKPTCFDRRKDEAYPKTLNGANVSALPTGKVSLPYKQFLGYEKGEDGLTKIVGKEAVIVRQLYSLFLEGKTPYGIAKHLTQSGISTPSGKGKWQSTTVESILTNEKYKGDALLQKNFTVDFLSKKMKANEGEIPQYYVENSHPVIISPEVFDLVHHEMRKRKESAGISTAWVAFLAKSYAASAAAPTVARYGTPRASTAAPYGSATIN